MNIERIYGVYIFFIKLTEPTCLLTILVLPKLSRFASTLCLYTKNGSIVIRSIDSGAHQR